TFAKGFPTCSFEAAFRMHPYEAVFPSELGDFLEDHTRHVEIPVGLIRQASPDSLSVMELRSQRDVAVVERASQFPLLGMQEAGVWQIRFQSEFHMTNDSHLFKSTRRPGFVPLYEGKMIHQFNHQFEAPRYWLDERESRKAVLGSQEDLGQKLDYQDFRLG